MNQDPQISAVGFEISANHVKSVSSGYVTATAKPYHMGKSIQFWEIKVIDEEDNLISHCKLSTLSRHKNKLKIKTYWRFLGSFSPMIKPLFFTGYQSQIRYTVFFKMTLL